MDNSNECSSVQCNEICSKVHAKRLNTVTCVRIKCTKLWIINDWDRARREQWLSIDKLRLIQNDMRTNSNAFDIKWIHVHYNIMDKPIEMRRKKNICDDWVSFRDNESIMKMRINTYRSKHLIGNNQRQMRLSLSICALAHSHNRTLIVDLIARSADMGANKWANNNYGYDEQKNKREKKKCV